MNESWLHTKEYCVYPGEYNPLPEAEALMHKLHKPGMHPLASPPLNMDEFEDCFRIEMAIPGVLREDIFIQVQHSILSVMVLHKEYRNLKNKKLQIHEFDAGLFERHLLLPDNADTEFIIAEYKQGMLNLYVPKTSLPAKNNISYIVVY